MAGCRIHAKHNPHRSSDSYVFPRLRFVSRRRLSVDRPQSPASTRLATEPLKPTLSHLGRTKAAARDVWALVCPVAPEAAHGHP